jgi:hypothetical protein
VKPQPTSTPTGGGTQPRRIRLAGGTGPALPLLSVTAADGTGLNLAPAGQAMLAFAAIVVVWLGLMAWTWRDIRIHPAEQIRGSKNLWRVLSAINISGSVAYWLIGRRWAGRPAEEEADEQSQKVSPADRRRLVTKLALVTSGLVVLGAAITAVRPDAGTSPAGRKTVPGKEKAKQGGPRRSGRGARRGHRSDLAGPPAPAGRAGPGKQDLLAGGQHPQHGQLGRVLAVRPAARRTPLNSGAQRTGRELQTGRNASLEHLETTRRATYPTYPTSGDRDLGEGELHRPHPADERDPAELLKHPVATRLARSGPMAVARDLAHATIAERWSAPTACLLPVLPRCGLRPVGQDPQRSLAWASQPRPPADVWTSSTPLAQALRTA